MASNDLNRWSFIGRLMADPEMRYTPTGKAVTSIIVAVNGSFTTADGETHKTLVVYRCQAWGKQAEVLNQYPRKGQRLYIEGRPNAVQEDGPQHGKPRIWTDKESNPRADYECTISLFQFLDKPANGSNGNGAPDPAHEEGGPASGEDENIPF